MPQGRDLGVFGCQTFNFSKHGHVVYQIEGDGKSNRIQVKYLHYGQTGDLGRGLKVKYY